MSPSTARLPAVIGVADPVKPGAREAIAALHKAGLRVVMLTGDHRVTAEVVARELNIDEVRAEVLPADKASEVARLQAGGAVVGMVGDGINDAPALARADVGFAIGSGTDVAMESADVTLIGGSLLGVLDAIQISRATVRNIRQNLFGAFIYNIVGIPVAAGVLYPVHRHAAQPDDRRRGYGAVLGDRGQQCQPTARVEECPTDVPGSRMNIDAVGECRRRGADRADRLVVLVVEAVIFRRR